MACLIKAPDAAGKGCVSFTTQERDRVIGKESGTRAAIVSLKRRFFVGLHHNWHDHAFMHDPLYDFSMAGDGDLIERDGKPFDRVPLDACNFVPACFARKGAVEPFWDVLNTSRAVFFKGLPEFYKAIRAIYDRGRLIRVLHLCPVPPPTKEGTDLHDIRQRFEALFSADERRFCTLMTMEWDNPFPLDLETLAFFYRASRVYVHPAPEERRCRVAAYAWASGMPVVARENVASILPPQLRRKPFWFSFDDPARMADAILAALDGAEADAQWDEVGSEFRTSGSVRRLASYLENLARARGETLSLQPINELGLDIRLGRHHGIASGPNTVEQAVQSFCRQLTHLPDGDIARFAGASDPEAALARAAAVSIGSEGAPAAAQKDRRSALQNFVAKYLQF